MTITNPTSFLEELEEDFFRKYKGVTGTSLAQVSYVEPKSSVDVPGSSRSSEASVVLPLAEEEPVEELAEDVIKSKIVTLGDFIDTDALSPGFTLTTCKTDEEFGQHVLCYTHPDFRDKVKAGQKVVVGGHAFGVGSSRETAVSALKGVGVRAVIAKSFAFIYGRNQPSLGLLGIIMENEAFYAAAKEGEEITIDVPSRTISVAGQQFPFQLSEIEYQLTHNKGVTQSYKKYGKAIWDKMTTGSPSSSAERRTQNLEQPVGDSRLSW